MKPATNLLDKIFEALCNESETQEYTGIEYRGYTTEGINKGKKVIFGFQTKGLELPKIDAQYRKERWNNSLRQTIILNNEKIR